MNPRYSIITPTFVRKSLVRCCESVAEQTCTDWEHHIWIDATDFDQSFIRSLEHPQRIFHICNHPHRDWGHSCRRNAWDSTFGEYVYYLDDDNILAHPRVLENMKAVTQDWAVFPILRLGEKFFFDPPSYCHVDTGSVLVKREFARWTESTHHDADWDFVKALMKDHPQYQTFPDWEPVMVIRMVSNGGPGPDL
jgi:glycosyltransferase involved in cell wall biosynthesis